MKAKMRFLKIFGLAEFLLSESKLFHSIIVEGKNIHLILIQRSPWIGILSFLL